MTGRGDRGAAAFGCPAGLSHRAWYGKPGARGKTGWPVGTAGKRAVAWSGLVVLSALCLGCASYVTPGPGARMALFGATEAEREQLTDYSIQQVLDRKPLAQFPTGLAVVRVQAPGYRSYTGHGWGRGRYSVVLDRDIETEEHFERLRKLPLVTDVATVSRLLLPQDLNSDKELRRAAAMLHTDVLLIYTLDTSFEIEGYAEPLTVLTLGMLPNQQASVRTTASGVLLDTRNGYVYAVLEATERHKQLANAWTSREAVDQSRRKTEAAAFQSLLDEFEEAWARVTKQYATRPVTGLR